MIDMGKVLRYTMCKDLHIDNKNDDTRNNDPDDMKSEHSGPHGKPNRLLLNSYSERMLDKRCYILKQKPVI